MDCKKVQEVLLLNCFSFRLGLFFRHSLACVEPYFLALVLLDQGLQVFMSTKRKNLKKLPKYPMRHQQRFPSGFVW